MPKSNPLIAIVDLWLSRWRRRRSDGPAATPSGRPAVVITGGSEGIGLALAHRFAMAGHSLVLIARHRDGLEAAAEAVRSQHGAEVQVLALDVTEADAAQAVEAALAGWGLYADVLVNDAGVGVCGAFHDNAAADLAGLIDLNVRALTLLSRHFLPGMLERGRGGILNIASLAGFAPGPFQATYYASKAYVISLTRAIGYETRGQGVRVAVVVPGPVNTRFHQRMGAEASFYRQLLPGASAEAVATSAYRGYRLGLGVVYPALATPLLALAMRLLPGMVLFPIIGLLLRPRSQGNV